MLEWRDEIGGKTGDDRLRHLQKIVGFALDRGDIEFNRLANIPSLYSTNRADLLWIDEEIDAFTARAPGNVSRILIAATETGFRPGDQVALSRFELQPTPSGRRIVLRSRKRGRIVSVPVTKRMAELLDSTPSGRSALLTNQQGQPYKHQNYPGDAVSAWRDRIKAAERKVGRSPLIRRELRLYDARGTAATGLLRAGADLTEIATAMGWSIKHATEVIERYVALHPDMTDALGAKIERLIENGKRTKP